MHLEKFSKEQQDFLVALPYRVGLWISTTDDTGGHEADAVEKQALEQVIVAYAEDFCKSELVERIMRETLVRRQVWAEWQVDIDHVPEECAQAVALISEHFEVRDVTSFKHNLMEIAVDVAMAFREVDYSENFMAKIDAYSRYYWGKLLAHIKKIQPPSLEGTLNISPAERVALKQLEQALGMDVRDGIEPVSESSLEVVADTGLESENSTQVDTGSKDETEAGNKSDDAETELTS